MVPLLDFRVTLPPMSFAFCRSQENLLRSGLSSEITPKEPQMRDTSSFKTLFELTLTHPRVLSIFSKIFWNSSLGHPLSESICGLDGKSALTARASSCSTC